MPGFLIPTIWGDDWKRCVTIEKILTDYAYDYPQVIKFKGDCLPENCGGMTHVPAEAVRNTKTAVADSRFVLANGVSI